MSAMDRLFSLMAEKHASDLYLSAGSPITIRIDGTMLPVNPQQLLTAESTRALVASVMTEAQMEELARTGELNVGKSAGKDQGNFRFSCFHQRGSIAAVVRYVAPLIPPIETLHLPPLAAELAMARRGLVLVVGATGCGKSTTVASMLDRRNSATTGHILTIEDPIEYVFHSQRSVVNQREVGTDTESLDIGLKNALRQSPDCIFIGEIRDAATMSAALAYAQSGHLCLSTLHANNAYQALHRILSFYPEAVRPTMLGELSTALNAIISQRLLKATADGRLPAVEIMLNTKLVSELIEKGDFSGIREAMEKSLAEGSQTFEEDLARMINTGLVSRDEGLVNSDSPTNLLWRLSNDLDNPSAATTQAAESKVDDDQPVFSDIVLDVHHTSS